jgi:hypothetical protein
MSGQWQSLSYVKDMTKYLYDQQIRIFDKPDFAQPVRVIVREFTRDSPFKRSV